MINAVILDTNLLVLLVVGLTNINYIAAHKRLSSFTIDDYHLLTATLSSAETLVVTPNTLSEASNLLRYIAEPAKSEIHAVFRTFILNYEERYLKSGDASSRQEFVRLGLTDSALLEVSKNDVLLLSVDLDLCIAAEIAQYKFINFNHLRDAHFSQTS